MTEIRVNTGLGMTALRSGSSTDSLISAEGFAVSLRQASAADTSTVADRPADTRRHVVNTDQTTADTKQNVQTSTENDAAPQDQTDILSETVNGDYATEVNGQLQANDRLQANGQPQASDRLQADGKLQANDQLQANIQLLANGQVLVNGQLLVNGLLPTKGQLQVNGQPQDEQTEVVISDELQAIIDAVMGKDAETANPQLTEQAKKFLEALAADEGLRLELKNMLTEALHKAFEKLKDPKQQEEEFNQKVLKFLEKFLAKMNNKDDKKTALEEGNVDNSAEGLLMQMLQNMILQMQGVQTKTTTVADAEALETQVIAPLDSVAALNIDMFESGDTQIPQQVVPEAKSEDVPVRTDSFVDSLENPEDLPKTAEAQNAQYQQIAQEVYDDVAEKFYQAVEDKAPELTEVHKVGAVSEENPAALTRLPENLQKRTRSSEEELEELKRLFGMQERRHKKPEELEESEESEKSEKSESHGRQQNTDTGSRKPTVTEDVPKFSERLNVESVTVTEKAEAPAVARSFTLGESGVKQVLSQVVTETLNNLPQEQGEKSFSMTLNPETLGRITVRMVENAGRVSIMVTAHNKDTAELLAQRLDGMESMMKQSGTQLEKCQVVYQPEQNDRAGQQNYDGSSKNPYVRQQDEKNTDQDGKFAEALQQAV